MKLRDVAIVGIGRTTYSKASGRTTLAMGTEAVRNALTDAGIEACQVDGMAAYQSEDSVGVQRVADAIGVDNLSWALDQIGGGNVATAIVNEAHGAVGRGMCDVAVVYRSLNGRSGRRFGQPPPSAAADLGQFGAPIGYMVWSQFLAMWAQRYMHEYKVGDEAFGHIAVNSRRHAMPNDHALQRDELTMDAYLGARFIHRPFRVYDCCLESDGAVALVITTLDRARDLKHHPVVPVAMAESHGGGFFPDTWPDITTSTGAKAAKQLWSRTDLTPADIDLACIYDCFTFSLACGVEDYGFCEKGAAGDYFAAGRATYGGDVVVNPHGGLLSEAYIHGLNHHYELVMQLRREAGDRQVDGAEAALVTSGFGIHSGGIIYVRDR